jgi:outer membrane protein
MKAAFLLLVLALAVRTSALLGAPSTDEFNRRFVRKGGDVVKAPGPAALELSFEKTVRLAGEAPASVVMSHERVQQAVARLGQTRSSLMPQLSATASQSQRTVNLAAQGITIPGVNPLVGPFQTFDARLRLTQALFDAETIQGLKFAQAGHRLALEQERKARQDTMALAAALYIEAKRAREGIALGKVLKERDEKELALARSQEGLGTGPETAVDEAEAHLYDSERFLTAAQADAYQRHLDLAAALDLPMDRPIAFQDGPRLAPPEGIEEIASTNLESHPDVAVARETLVQRQAQTGVLKAGYVPKISAQADYGQSGALPSDSVATYQFGGQLSVPIFEGGQRQKKLQEARHQVQESRTQLEDAREQTQAKAWSAFESVKRSWAGVQARESALRVADRELALARQKLKLGVGTDLEWIEQKARRAQAWDDREEAVATYQIARVGLAQALGKMEMLARSLTPSPSP